MSSFRRAILDTRVKSPLSQLKSTCWVSKSTFLLLKSTYFALNSPCTCFCRFSRSEKQWVWVICFRFLCELLEKLREFPSIPVELPDTYCRVHPRPCKMPVKPSPSCSFSFGSLSRSILLVGIWFRMGDRFCFLGEFSRMD